MNHQIFVERPSLDFIETAASIKEHYQHSKSSEKNEGSNDRSNNDGSFVGLSSRTGGRTSMNVELVTLDERRQGILPSAGQRRS